MIFEISIMDDGDFARGLGEGGADSGSLPPVSIVTQKYPVTFASRLKRPLELLQHERRVVRRMIVHDDDFDALQVRTAFEDLEAFQRSGDEVLLVVDWDQYGE